MNEAYYLICEKELKEWYKKHGTALFKNPITGKWVTQRDIDVINSKKDKNTKRLIELLRK